MELKFVRGNSLKEGGYVLIDEEVCRIKEVEKSKSGKHGAGNHASCAERLAGPQSSQPGGTHCDQGSAQNYARYWLNALLGHKFL